MNNAIGSLKQSGAAHVITTPMSKQHDELSSLWRHSPRLSMPSTAASSKDSSCSSDMLLVVEDALSGDDFLNLDDLDLEPLGGEYGCEARSAVNDMKSAVPVVSSPLIACASPVSSGEVLLLSHSVLVSFCLYPHMEQLPDHGDHIHPFSFYRIAQHTLVR